MDDRTAGGHGEASRERTTPATPREEGRSLNARPEGGGGTPANRRSAPRRHALTEQEQGEEWPLG
jgi:hypothetical protein